MSKSAKIRLVKYGCCAAFTLLMGYIFISLRDFGGASLMDKYRMLCDAFTVPGVLLVMVGCMVWLSNEGALDAITYSVSYAFKALIPGKRDMPKKYSDYVMEKRKKNVKGYGFLFISGAVDMLISGVFLILFYSLYQ